jgi:ABC-type Fe2+-enterobactin transport system substrate-binding protein
MNEKTRHDELKAEIEQKHFVRASLVAEQMGLPEEEVRNLRYQALGQMSVIYRNAHGTKNLALQYGFSKEEVKQILEQFANEMQNEGNNKSLDPCYDYSSGKYFSFEEWRDHYLKIWNKITI